MGTQVNRASESVLVCCTCPDGETKYNHLCACPSVSTSFASTQKTATLCGFNEYSGGPANVPPSVPPKRYLKKLWNIYEYRGPQTSDYIAGTWCYNGTEECIEDEYGEFCDLVSVRSITGGTYLLREGYVFEDKNWSAEASLDEAGSCVYPKGFNASNCNPDNPVDCAWTFLSDDAEPMTPILPIPAEDTTLCDEYGYSTLNAGYEDPNEQFSNAVFTSSTTESIPFQPVSNTLMSSSSTLKVIGNRDDQIRTQRYGISSGFGNYKTITFPEWESQERNYAQTLTLSVPDSDEEALLRAAEVLGIANSSIWELRTTDYNFVKRESTYTIKASSLHAGIQYKGCVVLERRRAYSGDVPEDLSPEEELELDWLDVEPDIIETFTAEPDESGITTVAEDVPLPHVEGWEYRVKRVGSSGPYLATVWPTYADCECPTEWEPEVV